MKTNRSKLFVILTLMLMLLNESFAGMILPSSSLWEGGKEYNENGFHAYLEYAVYDTQAADFDDVITNPGQGRYIYAYQLFTNNENDLAIAAFELIGGSPALANGIGSQDDDNDGIMPTNNGTSFKWTFAGGVFVADNHSAYMVFSSDRGPIEGAFKLSNTSDWGNEPPVNDNQVPEPATLALLATGLIGVLRRKK